MNSSFSRPVVPLPRPLITSTLSAASTATSEPTRYSYTMLPSGSTMGITWLAGMGHRAMASPLGARSMRA